MAVVARLGGEGHRHGCRGISAKGQVEVAVGGAEQRVVSIEGGWCSRGEVVVGILDRSGRYQVARGGQRDSQEDQEKGEGDGVPRRPVPSFCY